MPKSITTFIFVILASCLVLSAAADRTIIRPGWTLFSPQQDAEIGRSLSDKLESSMPIIDHHDATTYLDALGQQLAAHAPGDRFQYTFRIVDDPSLDAAAMPGGFVYVTRNIINMASNEPEMAGILAHEIAHVALRHGSQEISRAYSSRYGGAAGRVSANTVMSRMDIGVGRDSVALKYTPEEERQADIVATQILFDAGFDAQNMVRFMQKIRGDGASAQFFRNHPYLPNGGMLVSRETQNMGGAPRVARGDSPDFHKIKDRLYAAIGTRNTRVRIEDDNDVYTDRADGTERYNNTPDLPSSRMLVYRGNDMTFRYPDNWQVSENGSELTVAPDGGTVSNSVAYGMTIATFEPRGRFFGMNGFNLPGASDTATGVNNNTALGRATDQLIEQLRRSNANLSVVRTEQPTRLDGDLAMTTTLSNDSPLGGRETDRLVTVMRSDGLLYYFLAVAPQRDFSRYSATFDRMVQSVRFTN